MRFNRPLVPSVLLVATCVLLVSLPAFAATGGVMFVTGARQGAFKGEARISGQQGIPVIEIIHSVTSPRDAQSGQASGKRQWKPITIVKEVDSASPKFFRALQTKEVLQVKLEFNAAGKAPKTVNLSDARIVNIRKARQRGREVEQIEIIYQKIELTFPGGKKAYTDDWTL
jgi:type VI secretion system secreted protein Hcp